MYMYIVDVNECVLENPCKNGATCINNAGSYQCICQPGFSGPHCLDSKYRVVKPFITKTYLYNFDPLKPHFYMVKLGFAGVYIIFFISAQKHRLWVLVRTALLRRF